MPPFTRSGAPEAPSKPNFPSIPEILKFIIKKHQFPRFLQKKNFKNSYKTWNFYKIQYFLWRSMISMISALPDLRATSVPHFSNPSKLEDLSTPPPCHLRAAFSGGLGSPVFPQICKFFSKFDEIGDIGKKKTCFFNDSKICKNTDL